MFTRLTKCPNQKCRFRDGPNGSERLYGSNRFWIKRGHYRTKHDHRAVPRYSCRACGRCFNSRTGTPTAGQHKPHMNRQVFGMLCSGMTQRRTADVAGIARKTVERKFRWLASRAADAHAEALRGGDMETSFIQFDDMESVEHTKLKPLMIALAVRASTGQIIDARVGTITCKHRKADSERRYGRRIRNLRVCPITKHTQVGQLGGVVEQIRIRQITKPLCCRRIAETPFLRDTECVICFVEAESPFGQHAAHLPPMPLA